MSIGYMPKKRKQIKKMRRLRKKYKNFSCATCENAKTLSCLRRNLLLPNGNALIGYCENCPEWEPDKSLVTTKKVKTVIPEKKKNWYRRK